MLLHARDKDRDDFREEEGKTGVLIIAELFSEVVVVNQPVAGGKATDITGGIRQSDWYYKYKKLSESNVREWICPYISRHLLSLNPLLARCRRYSRGER
ncbi:hypothetical protein SNB04_14045, partial [Escherichia coli]|nr:hypothetical protein [Escherichia coli]